MSNATLRDVMRAHFARRGGFADFCRFAWPIIEGSRKLVWNWHLDVLCGALERSFHGEARNLLITMPPGIGKSVFLSQMYHPWVWTMQPDHRFITASYDAVLADRDSGRSLSIIMSKWYQDTWDVPIWDTNRNKRVTVPSAGLYFNRDFGMRFATSVRGTATGRHANTICVDDPHKPDDVLYSPSSLDRTWDWYEKTLGSRNLDADTTRRILNMQRLHEADCAGRVIEKGGYTHVNLPMEFDPDRAWKEDPRKVAGELLYPARFSREACEDIKIALGPIAYECQCNQRPNTPDGFFNGLIRFIEPSEVPAFSAGAKRFFSWDCAFKDKADSDFVAGLEMVYDNRTLYVVDTICKRLSFIESAQMIYGCAQRHGVRDTLIEDKANGTAVEDLLAHEFERLRRRVTMVNPKGGKLSRAHAVMPIAARGSVVWVKAGDWQEASRQITKFPTGAHDDVVDAFTQGAAFCENPRDAFEKLMMAHKRGYE